VEFTCSLCGGQHAEELRDIRLGLPDDVHALDAAERAARAWLADDFAILDECRFFVRGLLELPIPDVGGRFGYGTWVEVPARTFRHLLRRWHSPRQFEPVTGVLANELAPYHGTTRLAATLRPVSADRLPLVDLAEADHPLARDQRAGISVERSRELAAVVAHAM
jgi:hypothetical protein